MNILETFVTLFKTNAEEAEKDMAAAEVQAESLAAAMDKVGEVDASKAQDLAQALAQAADVDLGDIGAIDLDGFAKLQAALEASEGKADVLKGSLADAAAEAESVASALFKSLPPQEQILRSAQEIADAERNIQQYLLGNEALHEHTLDLLGGREGLEKRIAAETKRVTQELIKSQQAADGLGDELSEADREAQRLSKSFMGVTKGLVGALAAVVSVGAIIGGARAHIDATIQLIERASRARIDVSSYDAWRRAIRAAEGDAERAEGQFEAFADKVTEAFGDAESEAGKALAAMGVAAADAEGNVKSTDAALLDLADAMSKVSKQTAVDSLRRLGIVDPVMVDMILQGREGLERLLETQRKSGALTIEQANAYKAFRTAINAVTDAWRSNVDAVLGAVLPLLTRLFGAIKTGLEWMRSNSTLIQGFGIALAAALTIAAGVALAVYAPAMWAAAAATIAATWPILLLVAAVAALGAAFALAYEDVKAFLSGQPSLLGDLVAKYGWARDAVEGIGKAFKVVAAASKATWDAVRRGLEFLLPIVGKLVVAVGGVLVRAFRTIAPVVRGIWAVAGPILSVLREAIWTLAVVGLRVARNIQRAFAVLFGALMPIARPALDAVSGAVRAFGNVFANIAAVVRAAWTGFFSWFVDKVQAAANVAKGLLRMARDEPGAPGGGGGGGRPPGAPPGARATVAAIRAGRDQTRAADRAPTNRVTQAAVANRRPVDRTTNVEVKSMTVTTQATDAQGMARGASSALSSEIRRATQDNDDGVDR